MNVFGQRLKQARLAAKLSLRKLAKLVGVSHAAIKKYEDEKNFPSSDVLIKIAEAINVPIEYLFRPQSLTLQSVKFRKKNNLNKRDLLAINQQVNDQLERRLELENVYPIPPIKKFDHNEIPLVNIKTFDDIEKLAKKLRISWDLSLSPIHHLMNVFENKGIKVFTIENDSKLFDGLFARITSQPIIVISKHWTGDRQRFTLAHELAHFLLEGNLPKGMNEEQACHRFAGAFLFPAQEVIREFNKKRSFIEWKEIYLIKEKYGLSMQAICYRLKDLKIISNTYFQKLMIDFRKRKWHLKEPGNQISPEKPLIFEQLVFHALAESYIAEAKAAELLGITLDLLRTYRAIDEKKCAICSQ